MKKLFLLFLLLAFPLLQVLAQSFSGQSSGDVRVVSPYKFCVGPDNGTDVCLSSTGNQQAKITGTLNFTSLSSVRSAAAFSGADACAKLSAAIANGVSTGVWVTMSGLEGAQTCSTDPFSSVTIPVYVQLTNSTITATHAWSWPSNVHITGVGDQSVLAFNPASNLGDSISAVGASNIELDHVKVTGSSTTQRLVSVTANSSNVRVHHVTISGAIPTAPGLGAIAGIYIDGSSDVWVENSIFSSNGMSTPGTISNADIMVYSNNASSRVHLRNNRISGSQSNVSIEVHDCTDCDAIGNSIDQNNQIGSDHTQGGYGITFYQSTVAAKRGRIIGNQIRNTAGSGIYYASANSPPAIGGVIEGNTLETIAQQESDSTLAVGGIAVNNCAQCVVRGNTIVSSTLSGIEAAGSTTGELISHNTIKSPAKYGIWLTGAMADATVDHNDIDTPTNVGIFFDTQVNRIQLLDNTVRSGLAAGIYFTLGANDSKIMHNTVYSWAGGNYGIRVITGSANTITENTLSTSTSASIGIGNSSSNSTIALNNIHDITGGGTGIIQTGNDCMVSENTLRSLQFGIDTSGGLRSTVKGNKFINSVTTPLTLAASDFVDLNTSDGNTLGFAFANLPASPNGSRAWCTDCNSTCTAGTSNGRTCFRENGAWTH